jgi:hypothetical protein
MQGPASLNYHESLLLHVELERLLCLGVDCCHTPPLQ